MVMWMGAMGTITMGTMGAFRVLVRGRPGSFGRRPRVEGARQLGDGSSCLNKDAPEPRAGTPDG